MHAHLPRLARDHYRGRAFVHWCMTVHERQTGWLNGEFHLRCREALLHTAVRYEVSCPVYCLMPDHAHFIWLGTGEESDQLHAMEFFRRQTNLHLAPATWQKQGYDHVLLENERERDTFAVVCNYVLNNPVRKGLVDRWQLYGFSGALVAGYPDLDPRRDDFWDVFWKIYNRKTEAAP